MCSSHLTMDKRIVIIGAGASGLAAATKLVKSGFTNVTLLEAEPRIGGRIKSVPHGDSFIDMGAQWCHGQKNNVVYEMVRDLDLLEPSVALSNDSIIGITSNGIEISQLIIDKLMGLMSIMDNMAEECGEGSHGSLITAKYADALKQDEYKDVDPETVAQFLHWMHRAYRGWNAADSWFDASCHGNAVGEDCEGDQLLNWKRGQGYKTILDVMMKHDPTVHDSIPLNLQIYLNKSVTVVDWAEDNVSVIHCADGTKFDADHIICTVSLGVLQSRYQSMFSSELPLSKRNAIEGLKLGTVDKIYVEFESRFWLDNWAGFGLFWCESDLAEIRSNPDETWIEYLSNLTTVQYHEQLLCGWIAGVGAREMEALSDEVVKRVIMKWMRRFLKTYIIPEPVTIRRSRWASEPNFLGSYSYMSIVGDDLESSRSDLAAPVVNVSGTPVLQFAGEASEMHHFATVHGAIESGWREANRLIDHYKSVQT